MFRLGEDHCRPTLVKLSTVWDKLILLAARFKLMILLASKDFSMSRPLKGRMPCCCCQACKETANPPFEPTLPSHSQLSIVCFIPNPLLKLLLVLPKDLSQYVVRTDVLLISSSHGVLQLQGVEFWFFNN